MSTTPLHPGRQTRIFNESPATAGTSIAQLSNEADTILLTLWVEAVSGDLDVNVYAFTDDLFQRRTLLFSFPTISAPTANLLLRRAAITTQRIQVEATYTGACQFEMHARAIYAGLVETRIVGSSDLEMTQVTVPVGPAVNVIPAALTDRAGLVIKNWSTAGDVFLGATAAQAAAGNGYPLAARDAIALDVNAGVEVWAVATGGSADLRIAQAGG